MEPTLPDAPGGTPPPPPPPAPPMGEPTLPVAGADAPGGMEPTTQMPATDAMAASGVPPVDPPDAPLDPNEDPGEPKPWYKKPGPVALLVIVVLAILGLLAWLIFGGSDNDDDASATSSLLSLEVTDSTGAPLDIGFVVDVVGPADSPTSFVWLRPSDGKPGESAGDSTGSDGRVNFEWEADDSVADPANWTSTATIVANVPPGWTPPGPIVDCVLKPLDAQASVVSMGVELDSPDTTIDRFATLTFPNYSFSPGDSVTCKLAATAPVETTVVETTVVETTVVETTVPETTVPATTVPETTVAPAPTTTTTLPPPQPGETLWDYIQGQPALSEFEKLVIDAGLDTALQDPNRSFNIFAPTNEAINAARNGQGAGGAPVPDTLPSDPTDLQNLLLAHANEGPAIELADLLKLTEIDVLFGGPQPITADPAMIGDANILYQPPAASNGVLYLIDAVLTPQP
jgi:uncharacterized surface protein with fasciclin (FAS1) repeats